MGETAMKIANALLGFALVTLLVAVTRMAYVDVQRGYGLMAWAFVLMFGTLLVVAVVMWVKMLREEFRPRR